MKLPLILVVDDNETNQKLACDVLGFDGFEVLRASDASEASRVIAERRPDVILMDIQMPGVDGLTYTRQLKSDETTRHLVIVAVTSSAMIGDEERARQAGCDGYISKPIQSRRLGAQVMEAWRCSGSAATDESSRGGRA